MDFISFAVGDVVVITTTWLSCGANHGTVLKVGPFAYLVRLDNGIETYFQEHEMVKA